MNLFGRRLDSCTLLTYQQEKLQTVPYLFCYGDNESGKSTVLQVLKSLCYQPMYGVTIPSADLYGYLEDSDGQSCILRMKFKESKRTRIKSKFTKPDTKKAP